MLIDGPGGLHAAGGAGIKKLHCPVQIISTDGDRLSGSWLDGQLFRKCGCEEQSGWYRFHEDEKVPHAMLSRSENPVPGAVEKVEEIIFHFIDQGRRSQRD